MNQTNKFPSGFFQMSVGAATQSPHLTNTKKKKTTHEKFYCPEFIQPFP